MKPTFLLLFYVLASMASATSKAQRKTNLKPPNLKTKIFQNTNVALCKLCHFKLDLAILGGDVTYLIISVNQHSLTGEGNLIGFF
jgi:hypothetical protein